MADREDVHVTVPESAWAEGGEWGRLVATLVINGTSFHLEAIRVRESSAENTAPQEAWEHGDDDDLSGLTSIAQPDGPFTTVPIAGHPHVLYATPYPD